MNWGGKRCVQNRVSPAQSKPLVPASGRIDPDALEVTTTCSCLADNARREKFAFPNVSRQSFLQNEKIRKPFD